MKNSDLKIIAIIISIALFITLITSNAVSVASVIFLAKDATTEQTGTVNGGATVDPNQGATSSTGNTGSTGSAGGTVADPNAGSTAGTGSTASTGSAGSTASTGNTGSTASTGGSAGNTADTGSTGNAGTTADKWDTAKTFNFYKDAAHSLATKGNAGYDKIEWQVLENLQVGSVGGILQPVIDSFMTTKEEAEVQVQAKGSDDAKNRFPDCTLTDLSKVVSAEKKDLANGNYEITIIMQDEDTPMNEESSFLAKVTSSVLFWEDIERTIKEDVGVVSAINSRSVNYKGYKITAEMTKDGKFVSLGHYATVDITANATITVFTLDIGGTLYNNCEYSNFKY